MGILILLGMRKRGPGTGGGGISELELVRVGAGDGIAVDEAIDDDEDGGVSALPGSSSAAYIPCRELGSGVVLGTPRNEHTTSEAARTGQRACACACASESPWRSSSVCRISGDAARAGRLDTGSCSRSSTWRWASEKPGSLRAFMLVLEHSPGGRHRGPADGWRRNVSTASFSAGSHEFLFRRA